MKVTYTVKAIKYANVSNIDEWMDKINEFMKGKEIISVDFKGYESVYIFYKVLK